MVSYRLAAGMTAQVSEFRCTDIHKVHNTPAVSHHGYCRLYLLQSRLIKALLFTQMAL